MAGWLFATAVAVRLAALALLGLAPETFDPHLRGSVGTAIGRQGA